MEAIGVSDERQRLTVLRAIDKLDRLGIEGVKQLLGPGRKDESGDFTKGAGLAPAGIDRVEAFLFLATKGRAFDFPSAEQVTDDELQSPTNPNQFYSNTRTLAALESVIGSGEKAQEANRELEAIFRNTRSGGYGSLRVRFDPSVVRGLEYYTGAVFEAELLAEIPNEKGQPVVFGSVGGGGRYDGLVGRFMKDDVPATGFSIGVSRLQAALSALGKLEPAEGSGPVVVLVMDRDRIGDYQKMVADLRRADIPAELYLGAAGMKAQMKYADRRDAPLAIIQGGDEKAKGVVQIKDLVAGKQLAAGMADHDAYREARPGQEEVAEADLVEAVNRLLGRGERRP
jgi:histidyl-tRNA synthetase